MKSVISKKSIIVAVMGGAARCLMGTTPAYSSGEGLIKLVGSQSQSNPSDKQQHQQHNEQARQSQETPAYSEFGGAQKDQETRERHHQQFPESAQHLGPQEDEQGQRGAAGNGKPRLGHEEKSHEAGAGK